MSGQVISAVNLTDGSKHSIGLPYGVCSTAKDTAAKTVTVNGGDGFVLEAGAMVIVKFTNANSVASPTLNVNGTGAKSICRYGTTKASSGTTTTGWVAGAVQTFVYDGTNWIREYWNNTTYSNASLGQGYATQDNAAQDVAITATLGSYSLTAGGVVAFKANYNVLANSTLNINGKGAKPIWFRGLAIANNIIKAGDVATLIYDGTNYHLLAVDRWQSDIEGLKDYVDSAISEIPQSDWNQNDETAKDYIKNKPFGEKDSRTAIYLNEITINGFVESSGFYQIWFDEYVNLDEPVYRGETYNISWDGVEYSATLQEEEGGLYFGINYYSPSFNPDNLPFGIWLDYNWDSGTENSYATEIKAIYTDSSTSASYTVAIHRGSLEIRKIDAKYLPEKYATAQIVENIQSDLDAEISNREAADNLKMDKENPVGTGSFSMNRKANTTIGNYSHAEGDNIAASGDYSHAEGNTTTASGEASHAEGDGTRASGYASHAEGYGARASAYCSHAEGHGTKASSEVQHVQGRFNIEDTASTYLHIVGNGLTKYSLSNAHTLDWNGNAWFAGDVYVGSTSGTNKDEGSKKLATMDDIADASNITSGTLSSDRLPIVPVAKGGTGTGFSLIESADLQENPRVLLLKEGANGSRYFDAYSSLPVSLGGLGTRLIGNAQDNSLLVKQTDGNGNPFIDYTAHPKVESITVGNCTLNYDDDNKFLEFIFTSTTDTGTEV